MRYLFLVLFLVGCNRTPVSTYECAIFGMHGVQARLVGQYRYVEDAEFDTQNARKELIAKQKVSEETGIYCHKQGEE